MAAVSDMHGDLGPVFRILDEHSPDLLLCCGDWGDPGQVERSVYEDVLRRVPVLSVFGNHDDLDLLASLSNTDGSRVLLENGVLREAAGVRVAGISGIWAKSHRKPEYILDEELRAAGEALRSCGLDVLITHGCAIGVCDLLPGGRRGGHRAFLDAAEAAAPAVHLCGHLHAQQTVRLANGRLAGNVGNTAAGDYLLLTRDRGEWSLDPCSLP